MSSGWRAARLPGRRISGEASGYLCRWTEAGPARAVQEIRSRLLTPRELFTAQGFPVDYVIEGPGISRRSQLARCGNSVPPPVAAALVAANCADMAILREAAE